MQFLPRFEANMIAQERPRHSLLSIALSRRHQIFHAIKYLGPVWQDAGGKLKCIPVIYTHDFMAFMARDPQMKPGNQLDCNAVLVHFVALFPFLAKADQLVEFAGFLKLLEAFQAAFPTTTLLWQNPQMLHRSLVYGG